MIKIFIARFVCLLSIFFIVSGQLFANSNLTNHKKSSQFQTNLKFQKLTSKLEVSVFDVVEVEEIEEDYDNLYDSSFNFLEPFKGFDFFQKVNYTFQTKYILHHFSANHFPKSIPIWISIQRINI